MNELISIPVRNLHPHADNPRKDLGDLTELAASIREKGILQNLTVVQGHTRTKEEWVKICRAEGVPKLEAEGTYEPEFVPDEYTVIIGHRRLAAAKLAGLTEVPCYVCDMTEEEQFSTMMVENIQRCDLTMIEEADGYQMMLDMGSSVEDVSRKTGKSESTIRRRVALTQLDRQQLQQAQERGGTLADYEALMKIKDPDRRNNVLRSVGTGAFDRQLETAMEQQECDEFLNSVEAILEGFGSLHRQTEPGISRWNHTGWILHQEFSLYSKGAPREPTDGGEYIWIREPMWLGVFQRQAADTLEDWKRQRRQQVVERMAGIREELDRYRDFYEKQRVNFLKKYVLKKTDEESIQNLALSHLRQSMNQRCYCERVHPDAKTVAEILNCATETQEGHTVIPDGEWYRTVTAYPIRGLLACWYGGLHSGILRGYAESNYDRETAINVPVFRINHEMDLAYSGLMDLGYEIGDEEAQLLRGTHPLFREALALMDKYKKQLEAANHE